ncbi:tetratricopeptide repeat protein [Sphingomonas oligophenolica]|uniref:tetratricopeptide repeat protein n=1 Tax=Sphingomonas oligophenolica TaxID=301154 RepID=UPI001F4F4DF1|nr:tetratricopeptide repeat protein [Sphingomonas oligophenolica]
MRTAAADYAAALADTPGNEVVAAPAYRAALAAGDLALADRAAAALRRSATPPVDLALLPLAEAARRDDAAAADAAITDLDKGTLGILAPALRGWTAFARGSDFTRALDAASTTRDPLATRLALEQRAVLQLAAGATATGLATLRATLAAGAPGDVRIEAAMVLLGTGRRDAGRALLIGDDAVIVALRDGAGAKPTLGFGVSRLLSRVAADLTSARAGDLAIALSRTALIADPANDRARLLLANALARDGATDGALAALAAIPTDSAFARAAADARIAVLAEGGRDAEAIAAAKARVETPDAGRDDFQVYGDQLVSSRRYAEGAGYYRRVLDAGAQGNWAAWLQYGGALDEAGDWAAARPALEKAVALAPTEPLALNYLGYAMAERGGDIAAATKLLERAHALKPADLSIVDSLGWAYYLGGDEARALPLIERAARGDPANAEIGEHLGDVYWAIGRRYEARYAWRAAALTAAAIDAPRLAGKIVRGLPAR